MGIDALTPSRVHRTDKYNGMSCPAYTSTRDQCVLAPLILAILYLHLPLALLYLCVIPPIPCLSVRPDGTLQVLLKVLKAASTPRVEVYV
jgi:hypothetical protein